MQKFKDVKEFVLFILLWGGPAVVSALSRKRERWSGVAVGTR